MAGSAVVGLVAAAAAVSLTGPWAGGQRQAERAAARADAAAHRGGGAGRGAGKAGPSVRASAVLAALGSGAGPASGPVPPPTPDGLADTLDPLLKDPALGPLRTASVMDATTGEQVFGSGEGRAAVPASTVKIATAVAALDALGADHRIATRVVAGRKPGEIVLVGGGDPTLTEGKRKDAHGPASLHDLADRTAKALERQGIEKVELDYDVSRYSGPERHRIGLNENIAPVSPLMVDEGRLDDSTHGPAPRSGDPARDAARAFAGMLEKRGLEVKGEPGRRSADDDADPVAAVRSQPLSALVERMITNSDNDIAEALARQTAVAAGEPASFDGAGQAVRARLKQLDLPVGGAHFKDGSGLDRRDKVSAGLLARLLLRAADPDRADLRPALTGLPVAGFSGTLRSRYEKAAAGRGMVRAKTGTLTGVNTLAGTVVDADGRLLVFAFMTNGTSDPGAAQAALDRLAAAVANCGCR
ncbi:D-alanyl-D-alanine carboxypeptidase/D-alanyl-D-alanine-endopeptidase [Streptomyces sp. MTZ3.1]|uniref:D-alanyl-D-alanine carboxypeptidase/D-alanyl-D-alanine-endopeptidase n=1 Tax=Streptomyces meridianus TaxID=2938945 RepID=A0ABT0XEX3_9ACTN|nr:D-alanyl-D-alanine carboxypeptidase/D-alanyl-D-alanine-endopeptidase [Streptomyces meridianus]MCM2580337.1 D-alanyl-D-alanine carboxypeptidase/D-alanyl-D-alanine-endopeptidase [Streptomyces meridianus]